MKDLKCGLTTCKHNKGYCCCAKEIEVDKGTDCTTYEQAENKHVSMFEAAGDFVKADYSVDTAFPAKPTACSTSPASAFPTASPS